MTHPPADKALERVIGFWGGLAVIVGITIGSGIFRKPHTLARDVGDPAVILGLWVVFGVVSLCGARKKRRGSMWRMGASPGLATIMRAPRYAR